MYTDTPIDCDPVSSGKCGHLRELKKRWQIMVGSLYAITETHTLQTVQANCTVGSNFTSMSNQVGVDFFRGWEHLTAVHAFLQSLGGPGTDRGQILSSLARCTLQINIIPLLKHWYHCFKVVQISTHWHVSWSYSGKNLGTNAKMVTETSLGLAQESYARWEPYLFHPC